MLKSISRLIIKSLGWKLESKLPEEKQYVIIGAFHTSNWDFFFGILGLWALGLKASWVGKHTLFRGPFGLIFRMLGGIPVDRTVHTGFIHKVAELYKQGRLNALTIAPEGTRGTHSKKEHWKTGFYYIAHEAGVPIAMGFLDYKNKRMGVGATLYPTGDIQKDFEVIREFYQDKSGLRPELQAPVVLPPRFNQEGEMGGEEQGPV